MKLSLNDGWKLLYRDLDAADADAILAAADYIDAGALPCDVHMPLIREGIIKDPVVADYCYDSEWIEEKSWWFRRDFTVNSAQLASGRAILTLESLDLYADVYVNGVLTGSHKSCHYPFTADVKRMLREGENSLLVRLTAGAERIDPADYAYIAEYIGTEPTAGRGEKARAFLRKPQYVYGWDWGPRVATVGITKNAYLDFYGDVAVTRVHPVTLTTGKDAKMRFEVTFESYHAISTADAEVNLEVKYEGSTVLTASCLVLAQSGVNFVDFEAVIPDAKLWWPSGAGEQPLYTAHVTVKSANSEHTAATVRFGIRTVALNLEPDGDGRRFAVKVNGVDIFCKGGDWIPADSVYARVTREKYETLIREARECNFNMLRIWGGGLYERDEFYDYCDECGILIWQDFMFSCSLYPDDQEWFRIEAAKEIDYQTKRLSHHPSMALWCGNNENQWIFEKYYASDKQVTTGGLRIYNEIAPSAIRANCPEIPYWRSSPYGGAWPNDNEAGDRHHWHDCTMNPEMEKRITPEEYDKVTSRFVSEYGYIGPCSDETIAKYFGGNPVERGNRIWDLHNNTFEKATVPEGIRKHYADPENLSLGEYLRYARLVQGLMYSYSLESIRFFPKSGGSLFWMYNDTWGEVGWTIIDYYLDRKPSYYYVKRAFAPVRLILRRSGGTVRVMGVNDTPVDAELDLEYGYVSFAGEYDTARAALTLKAFSRAIVFEFPVPEHDLGGGVVFARADSVPTAILRTGDFREYKPTRGSVTVEGVEAVGRDLRVTLHSTGYSHAVSLDLPASVRLDDGFFDMLPGERRTITVYGAAGMADVRPVYLVPGQ